MKRDGRTLDHATLEEFSLLAVRRVREGEKPSEVIKSLGMNRTSIYRWLQAASGRGKGERALASRPATGRPTKLTPRQQAQVFRWINGRDPRQYGLDFGQWTRQIVATVIEQKFGVQLGLTAVGRLLSRLGLTPQKPLHRAYQRNHSLPGCVSDLNPNELPSSRVKRTSVACDPLRAGEKLTIRIDQQLHEMKVNRCLVRFFLRHLLLLIFRASE